MFEKNTSSITQIEQEITKKTMRIRKTALHSIVMFAFLLLLASCISSPVGRLQDGRIVEIVAPTPANFDVPSLSNGILYWADTRGFSNRSCGRYTCNYNIYSWSLDGGDIEKIIETSHSDIAVLAVDDMLVWQEARLLDCPNPDDLRMCVYSVEFKQASSANVSNAHTIFHDNLTLRYAAVDYYNDLLVIEKHSKNHFNHIILVDVQTGQSKVLPVRYPKEGVKSSRLSEPVIGGKGIIWFNYISVQDNELFIQLVGFNSAKQVLYNLSSSEYVNTPVIDLSRTEEGVVWVQKDGSNWTVWQYITDEGQLKKVYTTKRFIRSPQLHGTYLFFLVQDKKSQLLISRDLNTGEETSLIGRYKTVSDYTYERPYLVWSEYGHGRVIHVRKWPIDEEF